MSRNNSEFFKKNLDAFIFHYPKLKPLLLKDYPSIPDMEIIATPSGMPSARYRGIYIHSGHDPMREAFRLIRIETKQGIHCCIFAGFGLGYYIEVFIKLFPDVPFVVVEPDISMFLQAFTGRNLIPLLTNERGSYLLGSEPEALLELLDLMEGTKIQIIKLRALYDKNKDYFDRLDTVLVSFFSRKEINSNTLKRFGKLWVRNLIRNMRLLAISGGIEELKGMFKDIPALIIAAGPSLDEVLPTLGELQSRLLIIAVDTSVKACLRQGIHPDFIIVVDPQYWNSRHLDRCNEARSILVSESSTHPRVFRLLKIPLFFCSSLFPLGKYLENHIEDKGKLGAGGSVATSAWDFGRILGCKPIIFAGLDLGFPGLSTHYTGSFFEERMLYLSDRTTPIEGMAFSALHAANPFPLLNNNGGYTLTDKRLIIYKWWFENQLKIYPDSETFSLSREGIKIEGLSCLEIQDLLAYAPIRGELKKRVNAILSFPKGAIKKKLQKLKAAVKMLIEELSVMENTALKGLEELKVLQEKIDSNKQLTEILKKLDILDGRILTSVSKDIAGFLLQPLAQEILNTRDSALTP
ncbi:MAG: 6-hydroxymethylpterin diphosphokinase MptE-like protein, partial [Spirochaetota bacterium]